MTTPCSVPKLQCVDNSRWVRLPQTARSGLRHADSLPRRSALAQSGLRHDGAASSAQAGVTTATQAGHRAYRVIKPSGTGTSRLRIEVGVGVGKAAGTAAFRGGSVKIRPSGLGMEKLLAHLRRLTNILADKFRTLAYGHGQFYRGKFHPICQAAIGQLVCLRCSRQPVSGSDLAQSITNSIGEKL